MGFCRSACTTTCSTLNARRGALGLPVTDAYLGLHIGEVFYGNIGSRNRLDFTVVGPAETETRMISRPSQRPWLG